MILYDGFDYLSTDGSINFTLSALIKNSESFEVNEIGVILKLTHGWSAFDNITYYIFKNNGTIIAYSKQTPKSYLKKYKEKLLIKK